MTRQTLITLALGSCTLGLLPVACNNGSEETGKAAETAPAIRVFPIVQQKVTDYGEWFGYLRGDKETDIHPRVSGFLKSQDYRDGQFVKEGDVLFTIEDDLYKAQLRQAEANLQAAEAAREAAIAQREKAALDVKRYEALDPKAVSEKDLTDARQNLKSAVANEEAAIAKVNQMQAAVKQAQINYQGSVRRCCQCGTGLPRRYGILFHQAGQHHSRGSHPRHILCQRQNAVGFIQEARSALHGGYGTACLPDNG